MRRDEKGRDGSATRSGTAVGVRGVADVQDHARRGQLGQYARIKMRRARAPAVATVQRRNRHAAEGVETGARVGAADLRRAQGAPGRADAAGRVAAVAEAGAEAGSAADALRVG